MILVRIGNVPCDLNNKIFHPFELALVELTVEGFNSACRRDNFITFSPKVRRLFLRLFGLDPVEIGEERKRAPGPFEPYAVERKLVMLLNLRECPGSNAGLILTNVCANILVEKRENRNFATDLAYWILVVLLPGVPDLVFRDPIDLELHQNSLHILVHLVLLLELLNREMTVRNPDHDLAQLLNHLRELRSESEVARVELFTIFEILFRVARFVGEPAVHLTPRNIAFGEN